MPAMKLVLNMLEQFWLPAISFFSSARTRLQIKRTLDQVIADHRLSNKVFLRRPKDLELVLKTNPFPDAVLARPNYMLVLFMEGEPTLDTRQALTRCDGPERVHLSGCEIFVDYVEGVARSN